MQVGGARAGAAATQGPANEAQDNKGLERLRQALDRNDPQEIAQIKDHPRAQTLTEKLRDPDARAKLEKILDKDILEKLDRIFNAPQPGTIPLGQKPGNAAVAQGAMGD